MISPSEGLEDMVIGAALVPKVAALAVPRFIGADPRASELPLSRGKALVLLVCRAGGLLLPGGDRLCDFRGGALFLLAGGSSTCGVGEPTWRCLFLLDFFGGSGDPDEEESRDRLEGWPPFFLGGNSAMSRAVLFPERRPLL